MAERKVIRRGKDVIPDANNNVSEVASTIPDNTLSKVAAKKKTTVVKKKTTAKKEKPITKEKNKSVNEKTSTNNTLLAHHQHNYIGDPDCLVYYAMDFTSLKKDNDPIAISLVDSEGNTFTGVFNDYNVSKASAWTFVNIIKKLKPVPTVLEGSHWSITGTRKEISQQLIFWIDEFLVKKYHGVQFVSDCPHYSFVNLCELLLPENCDDGAVALPHYISRTCIDLNTDLAVLLRNTSECRDSFKNLNPFADAFGLSREELVKATPAFKEDYDSSNTLSRAKGIRAIHRNIWNIEI